MVYIYNKEKRHNLYLANKEKISLWGKEYYRLKKKQGKHLDYFFKNKEKIYKRKNKKGKEKRIERRKKLGLLPYGTIMNQRRIKFSEGWYRIKFQRLRISAKQRGNDFSLSLVEYKEIRKNDVCFYCDKTYDILTIDRVDNNLGYIKENCVVACRRCNYIKSDSDFEILSKISVRVREFLNKN